jgi:hypothetical protein
LHSEFEKHFGAAQVWTLLPPKIAKRMSGAGPERSLKSVILNGSCADKATAEINQMKAREADHSDIQKMSCVARFLAWSAMRTNQCCCKNEAFGNAPIFCIETWTE